MPFRSRVVILMYHRVIESSPDPWHLCVTPKHFAEHLKILKQNYRVLSLHDLSNALEDARLPRRGVVLTFDDGYADNLWNAKPLLEKHEVPATVFVASGSVNGNGFWWDEIEQAVLRPVKLPKSLQLNVHNRSYDWPTENLNQRQHAYVAIHKILKPLGVSHRDRVVAELFNWAGIDKTGRSDCRPLTTAELIQLSKSECVDIGAHTVTHASLSILSREDQVREVGGSRRNLTTILGRQVDTFSYPYGNYTPETVDIVRVAGFEMALTSGTKAVEAGADRFQLGRFEVGDWDGETFERHLHEFFRTL